MALTPIKRFSNVLGTWGACTKDPKSDGRKITASGFSHKWKMEDLLDTFGGTERVEGATLFRRGFAILHFKKQSDYIAALDMTQRRLDGYILEVLPYDRNKRTPPQRQRHLSQPDRPAESRVRSRSRSGGRSRSRSPIWINSSPPSRSPRNRDDSRIVGASIRNERDRNERAPIRDSDRDRRQYRGRESVKERDPVRERNSIREREPARERESPRERAPVREQAPARERDREATRDKDKARGRDRSVTRSKRSRSKTPRRRSPRRTETSVTHWAEPISDKSLVPVASNRDSNSNGHRSKSRSRSTSPANNYRNKPVNLNFLDQHPETMASLLMNYNLETRARSMQTTFGGISHPRTTFQSPILHQAGVIGDTNHRKLPSDVELIMKLAIAQGTTDNLSLANVDNVINYWISTRLRLLGQDPSIQPSNSQPQHHEEPISGNDAQPQANQVSICNKPPASEEPQSNGSQTESQSQTQTQTPSQPNPDATTSSTTNSAAKSLQQKLEDLNRYNKKH